MPEIRNGNCAGKGEKRRVNIFTANLEEERWTLSDIRPSKSIRCYNWNFEDSGQPPSSSSIAAPPVETLALTGIPIAIDFHRVFGDGSLDGFIPTENVRAYAAFIAAGFVPWILSYIGHGGRESDRRRKALEQARRYLAKQLGLSSDLPSKPIPGNLFAFVCERKLFHPRLQCGGKAEQLEHFDTQILLDDSKEICEEAAAWGQLAYRVPRLDFPRVVDEVISNLHRGTLNSKIEQAWEERQP